MKRLRVTSRLFEQILGSSASLLSIIMALFVIFVESGARVGNSFIAVLTIAGSLLGFLSTFYIQRDLEYAGMGFIIAAMLILIGVPRFGFILSVMLLIAGISCLFRK